MDLFVYISDFIVPSIIILIVTYGVLEKVKVYDEFVNGAKKGLTTVIKIMPTLVGLMVAVSILRASGFLEFLSEQIGKVTDYIGLPSQLVPLSIVRLFSASAATGLVLDIFKEYGTDSFAGLTTSLALASTETVFYTMSVYFMAAKVTKTKWTLAGALLSTFSGLLASLVIAGIMTHT